MTTVLVLFGWIPTISISSFLLSLPRSTRPVVTVPRPSIVNTSSIGIRNGLSTGRSGSGDVGVDRVHELHDLGRPLGVALEGLERGDANDRDVVPGVLVPGEELAQVELDQLDELLVVDHVALVERDHEEGHADLAGQDDVLAGLRHGAVVGGHDEDRAVHLGSAGDHVLDVVLVSRAVHVRVVALLGLVLDVGDRDCDATSLLFRRLVDLVERLELGQTLL